MVLDCQTADSTALPHLQVKAGDVYSCEDVSEPGYYLSMRLRALHNHLISDPFNSNAAYLFNGRGHVLKYAYGDDSRLGSGEVVWQADMQDLSETASLQSNNETSSSTRVYTLSLAFPTEDLAVVSNGQGMLSILETKDRTQSQSWLVAFEEQLGNGVITEVMHQQDGHTRQLDILLQAVVTPKHFTEDERHVLVHPSLENSEIVLLQIVQWLTISFNGATWEVTRERRLAGRGALEYCAFDQMAKHIILISPRNYYFVYDSVCPVVKTEPKASKAEEAEKKPPRFVFSQMDDDISVCFKVEKDVSKGLIEVKIAVNSVKVKVKDEVFLEGQLLHSICPDESTWTLMDGKLEVILTKSSKLRWTTLLENGNAEGEEVLDPKDVEEAHKLLEHLTTTTQMNTDPSQPAYNPGELEACDEASEDLVLFQFDGNKHELALFSNLGGTQHLFNMQGSGDKVRSFCLRHDVDGLVWQPQNKEKFVHINTFHAFGYVKASKTMAKFTCAAPDYSYVAVADVKRHIYVFFQSNTFGGELRNRKTGKRTTQMARQLILDTKSMDEILGLHAGSNILMVLTKKNIMCFCLRDKQ
ncbi:nudC domain-containing protein 1 isoform X2 [Oratosquilla oratoria]|uniref:nudC domain-containing protein 1 isoform X2 n=1 Tax=Oratosquilla oratoria TaxID=337810 RepID=UPI003F7758FA